jgi:hypothetical protein
MKIHFNSGGNFFHFYLGYASLLQKIIFKYPHIDFKFSGVSAGSIAAGFTAFNIPISKIYPKWSHDIQNNLTDKSKIIEVFTDISFKYIRHYHQIFPLEIHTSKILLPYIKEHTFNNFNNAEDLMNKIIASCFIPIFSNSMAFHYNNYYYIDGILTFNPVNKNIDKIIYYRNYNINFSVFDKIPNKNYSMNKDLYNIGKKAFINDFNLIKIN